MKDKFDFALIFLSSGKMLNAPKKNDQEKKGMATQGNSRNVSTVAKSDQLHPTVLKELEILCDS